MTHQIPPRLVRFATEYEEAARRELVVASRPAGFARRCTIRLVAASTSALVALAVAAVFVANITAGASPAYALVRHADGSITISLQNLTAGISQLNARLQQLGINYTVIPITASCTTATAVLSVGTGNLSETITIGNQNLEPAGVYGYLAAEQLPSGQIGLAAGGMKAPLPTCFSPATLSTEPVAGYGSSSAAQSSTSTNSAPLPLPPAIRRHLNKADSDIPATSSTSSTTQSQSPSR